MTSNTTVFTPMDRALLDKGMRLLVESFEIDGEARDRDRRHALRVWRALAEATRVECVEA